MADNDKRPVPPQPAEDYYGRPTDPRHGEEAPREATEPKAPPRPDSEEEEEARPPRRELTEADEKGVHLRTEEEDDDRDLRFHDDASGGLHLFDPRERTPGAMLDDIPDGDGPRSDAGTNPLSDVYRYGHPDRCLDV